ncbi:response regulator [Roseospira marina]|uniref:Response regulator n=1 Tax=Roseospira marina TaxID=140057 RepID=A0A5M6IDS9_9PROT|nr:response regulator [Roseospira marina]KAA5606444.1 response regulator [Roseospira marina]MBB4314141.1 CheY-like chemotaxis protein [Roseospira marina]MBB5087302.1 CheY-like chemotaxis protein [Roseospira marina]
MSRELRRILYVDDEVMLQKVGRIALEKFGGFEVHVAGSGEEALTLAPECAPDLILLDVMMPGLDGPETFARLRALPATRETPVVFITAKAQPEEVARFKALGALGVMTKPYEPRELGNHLRALWSEESP